MGKTASAHAAAPKKKQAKRNAEADAVPEDNLEKVSASSVKPLPALGNDNNDNDDVVTDLRINEKFARTYMERKQKEELTRLERRGVAFGDGEDDEDESESETEDEDGDELTPELDADIQRTLQLIRRRDPIIYKKSVAFFKPAPSDNEEDEDEDAASKEKQRAATTSKDAPLYYKDLVRRQVLEGDVNSDEEGEDEDDRGDSANFQTFAEEQRAVKDEFLKSLRSAEAETDATDETAVENNDDDLEGGLFTKRSKSSEDREQEDAEYAEFRTKYGSKLKKDDMEAEAFLEHYLTSEGWKEQRNVIPHYEDIVKEDEEDAEELEKMENYEHAYNFRFEEDGGGQIQTYSRNIEDSVRRQDSTRKKKREDRKERKALERLKLEEELKRLKKLKQAEIQSKLDKIATLMGKGSNEDPKVLAQDLEGDFDPEEYDKRMQQIFDDEYYNENEDDEDMEKPTWDDEEDKQLFGDTVAEEEEEEEENAGDDDGEVSSEEEAEEAHGEEEEQADVEEEANGDDQAAPKDLTSMTPEELKRAKDAYLDELYGLDYEDIVGGLKTRFKYRSVASNDFGLTVDEIMDADDKELKQLVSLKRLAPYVEDEYTVHRRKVKQFRYTLQEKIAERSSKRKKREEAEETHEEGISAEDAETSSKKRKRSRRKATGVDAPSEAVIEPTVTTISEALPTEESQPAAAKKPKRRGGKKKKKIASVGSKAPSAAQAKLTSSRLESYKLLKKAN